MTVGILPGTERTQANPWVTLAIPTGMGHARNLIIVQSAAVIIAIGGEYGTLSEIALARKVGRPVIGLMSWELGMDRRGQAHIWPANDAADAVELALAWANDHTDDNDE